MELFFIMVILWVFTFCALLLIGNFLEKMKDRNSFWQEAHKVFHYPWSQWMVLAFIIFGILAISASLLGNSSNAPSELGDCDARTQYNCR